MPIIAATAAKALLPILVQSGTKVLADIVEKKLPGAGVVVREIASALGTDPTPEAIARSYKDNPGPVIEAAREVEANDPAMWEYLAGASAAQAALLAREDARESWFSWGWRPALSWLLILLWLWGGILLPLINAGFGAKIPSLSIGDLVTFSGIWLAIYGGGHTAKDVATKWAETRLPAR